MCSLHSKTDLTFLLYLITFEPIELKQNFIPHLKVLLCGIYASSSQWCGCIFILCHTHLKLALLLHKQGFVATEVATTVNLWFFQTDLTVSLLLFVPNDRKNSLISSNKIKIDPQKVIVN